MALDLGKRRRRSRIREYFRDRAVRRICRIGGTIGALLVLWELGLSLVLYPKVGLILLLTVLPLPFLLVFLRRLYLVDVERFRAYFGWSVKRLVVVQTALLATVFGFVSWFRYHVLSSHVLGASPEDALMFDLAIVATLGTILLHGTLALAAVVKSSMGPVRRNALQDSSHKPKNS